MGKKTIPGTLPRGCFVRLALFSEDGVRDAIDANHDARVKARRTKDANRVGIAAVACLKAEARVQGLTLGGHTLALEKATAVRDFLQRQVKTAVDGKGSRYSMAWDLGDAPWQRIVALVVRDCAEIFGATPGTWELQAAEVLGALDDAATRAADAWAASIGSAA